MVPIGVIYVIYMYEEYLYPTFWTGGTVTPTFQDTSEEFAAIRGELRRLNYTKTVCCHGSAPDPAR